MTPTELARKIEAVIADYDYQTALSGPKHKLDSKSLLRGPCFLAYKFWGR